jgi:DNA mismatch endonuclease (patch repair protein)
MRMADTLTPAQRSERMARIRSKDTKPELWVRRILHSRGFRFRLHRKDLPGRPDLVLPKYGAVVFVQGCFWHVHHCQKGRVPGTRGDFWKAKFEGNKKRDARNTRALRAAGWRVFTIWECELAKPATRERALERMIRKLRRGA